MAGEPSLDAVQLRLGVLTAGQVAEQRSADRQGADADDQRQNCVGRGEAQLREAVAAPAMRMRLFGFTPESASPMLTSESPSTAPLTIPSAATQPRPIDTGGRAAVRCVGATSGGKAVFSPLIASHCRTSARRRRRHRTSTYMTSKALLPYPRRFQIGTSGCTFPACRVVRERRNAPWDWHVVDGRRSDHARHHPKQMRRLHT